MRRLLTYRVTVDGMVSCGITRRKPISLPLRFLRATNARKPLKPACTIPCVSTRYLLYIIYLPSIRVIAPPPKHTL